ARRAAGGVSDAGETDPARIPGVARAQSQPEQRRQPAEPAAARSARDEGRGEPLRNRTPGGRDADAGATRAIAGRGPVEAAGAAAAGPQRTAARTADRVA